MVGWLSAAVAVVVLLAYALNLPFYAGGGLGPRDQWRMEAGQVTWSHGHVRQESFWVAGNSSGGLRFGAGWRSGPPGYWTLTVPLWMPLALLAAGAAWGLWGVRLWRRHRAGGCPRCGYDLRGIDGGVCPECGRPASNG